MKFLFKFLISSQKSNKLIDYIIFNEPYNYNEYDCEYLNAGVCIYLIKLRTFVLINSKFAINLLEEIKRPEVLKQTYQF